MRPTQLEKLAEIMKAEAKMRGQARRSIGETHLTLFWGNQFDLCIARFGNWPRDVSKHEHIRAFKIPSSARTIREERNNWYRIWYRWSEPVPLTQIKMAEDENPANNYQQEES